MSKRNRGYFFLTLLIAALVLAGYQFYSILENLFPLGFQKTVSMGLELKEFSEDYLSTNNVKGNPSIDVLHYAINIDLYPKQKVMAGDVAIQMKVAKWELKKIQLDFYDNLTINKITLDDKQVYYDRSEKLITLENVNAGKDTITVRIQYSGTPKSLGFGSFNFEDHDNSKYVYTLSEPVFASTWLPCVDNPTDKALMDMYISNDSSAVSLSNGKLIEVKNIGERKIYHWKTFYPISTYLIAVYSGAYKTYSQKYISINKVPVELDYYAFPKDYEELKSDCEDHQDYIRVFEELFGAYPFPKEKYSVAEFLWQSGAMEHQTITGIGSNFISGRKFFKDMLIHELAHHWWGNAVGPKTWKDIWLNEGFATYSEALYWEKAAGFSSLKTTLAAKTGSFSDGILHEPGKSLFSRLVYDKGAWVLHMLRKEVGDRNFFEILKTYFSNFKYGNASTNDFKILCEKISGKNLKFFFDQWVYKGEGRIELAYDWSADLQGNAYSFTINTEQIQNGYEVYKFPLEIKLIYGDKDSEIKSVYITSKNQRVKFILPKKPVDIELDPDKWLLAEFESRND